MAMAAMITTMDPAAFAPVPMNVTVELPCGREGGHASTNCADRRPAWRGPALGGFRSRLDPNARAGRHARLGSGRRGVAEQQQNGETVPAPAFTPGKSSRGRDGPLAFMRRYTLIQAKTLGRAGEAQTAVLEGGASAPGILLGGDGLDRTGPPLGRLISRLMRRPLWPNVGIPILTAEKIGPSVV
jgi:hypothetical protein